MILLGPIKAFFRVSDRNQTPPARMRRWVPNSMKVASGTGAAVAVLGASVLVGWYAHFLPLIQVLPHLTPMQRTTALSFFLSGSAILLIAHGRRRTAAFLAAIPLVFA